MMKMLHEDSEEESRNLISAQHGPYCGRHIVVIWKVFEILAK